MPAYSQDDLFGLPDLPGSPPAPDAEAPAKINVEREKLRLIHEKLCREYGCPVAYFHEIEPLDELVSSLLSHRTRNAESGAAYDELRRRFSEGWEAVRDAPTADVRAAIAACNWPEQKAPRLQQILRLIGERRGGELSLDFLEHLPIPGARAWLEALPGVGPKTSAAVLIFSRLRRRALPVDSHHHRVAQRLGLIPPSLDVGPAHRVLEDMLPPEWDAQMVYDDHEILMFHGQRCCYYRAPECPRCVLLDLCPTGQQRLQKEAATPVAPRKNPSTGTVQAKNAKNSV